MQKVFNNVSIAGTASIDAPHVLTSDEIEFQLKDVMDRFSIKKGILEKTAGISDRRLWDKGFNLADGASKVGEKVLNECGIDRKKIGVLINSSVCRKHLEPSIACEVHHQLNLSPQCINFDVTNACLGFLNSIHLVSSLIESGQIEYGMIVNAESSREVTDCTIAKITDPECNASDFWDNIATFTMGSGAVAMVLGRRDVVKTEHRFLGATHYAHTKGHDLCYGDESGITTNTKNLFLEGLELLRGVYTEANNDSWTAADKELIIPHQPGKKHIEEYMNIIEASEEQVYTTLEKYGNLGPASIPFSLTKAMENNKLQKGDKFSFVGFASGLNASILDFEW
ncbi:MAG: 3-oxoacyl-ACP synthase III [bacterium]|nr:3-oxoacyl-ACP synthase III [bacterium]